MDDNRQDTYSKKSHYYPRQQSQQKILEEDVNEYQINKSQSPQNIHISSYNGFLSRTERDSQVLNEQKVAKLNKMFEDALVDFTSSSEYDDFGKEGASSIRGYRDKKAIPLGINNEGYTNTYRKMNYSNSEGRKADLSDNNNYLENNMLDSSSTAAATSLSVLQQRRFERKKQNDTNNQLLSRQNKTYSPSQKYNQAMLNPSTNINNGSLNKYQFMIGSSSDNRYMTNSQDSQGDGSDILYFDDQQQQQRMRSSRKAVSASSQDAEPSSSTTLDINSKRVSIRSNTSETLKQASAGGKMSLGRGTRSRTRKMSNSSDIEFYDSVSVKSNNHYNIEGQKGLGNGSNSSSNAYSKSYFDPIPSMPKKPILDENPPLRSQSNSPKRRERQDSLGRMNTSRSDYLGLSSRSRSNSVTSSLGRKYSAGTTPSNQSPQQQAYSTTTMAQSNISPGNMASSRPEMPNTDFIRHRANGNSSPNGSVYSSLTKSNNNISRNHSNSPSSSSQSSLLEQQQQQQQQQENTTSLLFDISEIRKSSTVSGSNPSQIYDMSSLQQMPIHHRKPSIPNESPPRTNITNNNIDMNYLSSQLSSHSDKDYSRKGSGGSIGNNTSGRRERINSGEDRRYKKLNDMEISTLNDNNKKGGSSSSSLLFNNGRNFGKRVGSDNRSNNSANSNSSNSNTTSPNVSTSILNRNDNDKSERGRRNDIEDKTRIRRRGSGSNNSNATTSPNVNTSILNRNDNDKSERGRRNDIEDKTRIRRRGSNNSNTSTHSNDNNRKEDQYSVERIKRAGSLDNNVNNVRVLDGLNKLDKQEKKIPTHHSSDRHNHLSSVDRIDQFFKKIPESYKSQEPEDDTNDRDSMATIKASDMAKEGEYLLNWEPVQVKKDDSIGKIDFEPRKFLYKGRVWQVINSTQAKDRYLFLFSDMLIITKPIRTDENNKLKFQIKSILECKRLRSTLREERMSLYDYSRYFSHPAVVQAIHRFATNHIKALREIIEQNLLPCTPDSISYFLHCAPNLSKRQIGCFLGLYEHTDILESYLTDFPFRLMSIDESFRLLLQSLTLPQDAMALDHLLEVFSKKWFEENKNHLSITLSTTLRIVYSILELNNNMYEMILAPSSSSTSSSSNPPDTHSLISLNDYILSFTNSDGTCCAPPGLLTKIYKNIEKEKLETSIDIREEKNSFTLSYISYKNSSLSRSSDTSSIKHGNSSHLTTIFPSRLSQRETSDYITVTIPSPDPDIQIQIYGQDLRIEPAILHFTNSNSAQFRVRASKSQGRKLVMFYKMGINATKYYSIEPKCIVIEPAFLKWSFGMEYFEPFPDNSSVSSRSSQRRNRKKRYLFAVKERQSKEDWLKSLEPVTIPKEKFSLNGYSKKKRRRRHSSVSSSILDTSLLEDSIDGYSDLGSISGEFNISDDENDQIWDMSCEAASFILKENVLPTDGPFLSEEKLIKTVINNGKLSLIIGWLGELTVGHRTLKLLE